MLIGNFPEKNMKAVISFLVLIFILSGVSIKAKPLFSPAMKY
jgi:hypothetical protein